MHDVESKVFVVTELPAVMATIYFSVFHSVLVPYFRMKAGASEVKTEEQHTVVLLRKPSFHQKLV